VQSTTCTIRSPHDAFTTSGLSRLAGHRQGSGCIGPACWWGLNDTIKGFCTRLAEAGFVAFAPDLYHARSRTTLPVRKALAKALGANYVQANAEIADATLFLNERAAQADRGVAVIGFSLGATLRWTSPQLIPNTSVPSSSSTDRGRRLEQLKGSLPRPLCRQG